MRFLSSLSRSALAAAGLIGLAMASGCAREYANYPPIQGDTFAVKDLNSRQMQDAMAAALRWTVLRYPPPGGAQEGQMLAINLPPGIGETGYAYVAERVGEGAVPLTEENAKRLPVYHVTRVWLRGTTARIDVVRPLFEVGEKPGRSGRCRRRIRGIRRSRATWVNPRIRRREKTRGNRSRPRRSIEATLLTHAE
jgi:hypothetical protein